MSLIITNAKLLNYNYKTNFYGSYKFGYIQTYNIEGQIISTINFNQSQGANFAEFKDYISNLKTDTEISVNGKSFGLGRIVSISNSAKDNQSISLNYNISFEIYSPAKSTAIGNINIANSDLIEDFSEDFDFKITEEGFRECTHSLEIKYRDLSAGQNNPDSSSGPIKRAKDLANSIFSTSINFNFLNTVFNDLKTTSAKPYYQESYDLISHKCSFEKTFKVIKNNPYTDISHEYNHSFNLDDLGIVTINEKGKIQGLGSTTETSFSNAKNKLNTIITDSFSRCNTVFNQYKTFQPLTNADNLLNSHISLRKNFNSFEGYIEYEIVYTNDQKYLDVGYRHEYENIFTKDQNDIIVVQRNGTYKKIGSNKASNFNQKTQLIAKINSALNGAAENLQNLYSNYGGQKSLFLLTKNLNYPNYGNEMTYSLTYSDSEEFNVPQSLQSYFTNISLTFEDTAPSHIYNEYTILGIKRFMSAGNQTNLGKRLVNFRGTLKKTAVNVFNTNLLNSSMLNAVKTYVISKSISSLPESVLKIVDAYIVSVDYSADSKYSFQFNLELAYTSIIQEDANMQERSLSLS